MFDWKAHRLRGLHLCSALLIGLFLLLHLGNHIYGLGGQQAHIDYMTAVRPLYRSTLVESLLIALICWQAVSGLTMAVRGWRTRQGVVAWLQALSGIYLAFFLLNHVGAVIGARAFLGLDTDFRFAAAGFAVWPWPLFFAPYYFLAVVSLFAHLGCAGYWILGERRETVRGRLLVGFLGIGIALGLAIVASLAGFPHPTDIPAAYRATFGA